MKNDLLLVSYSYRLRETRHLMVFSQLENFNLSLERSHWDPFIQLTRTLEHCSPQQTFYYEIFERFLYKERLLTRLHYSTLHSSGKFLAPLMHSYVFLWTCKHAKHFVVHKTDTGKFLK